MADADGATGGRVVDTLKRETESVVRGLASAWRSLRLYPPTSPIPREAAAQAASALERHFQTSRLLTLRVTRDGLASEGAVVPAALPGVGDLTDALRRLGVAEVAFMPGCVADELVTFLGVVSQDSEQVKAAGGVAVRLSSAGVAHVSASDVVLTVAQSPVGADADQDVDAFLRELGVDPSKLGAWLSVAATGDPSTLSDGLAEIENAMGFGGRDGFLDALKGAFMGLDSAGRDALIGLALSDGPERNTVTEALGALPSADMAASLVTGAFGQNMLSLSNAVVALPGDDRFSSLLSDVERMLPSVGKSRKDAEFLRHMVEVRARRTPEAPLAAAVPDYAAAMAATQVDAAHVNDARAEAAAGTADQETRGIATMLTILDQQSDLDLYRRDLDMLASTICRLVERGKLKEAADVLGELSARETRAAQPWPELTALLGAARAAAAGPATLRAVLESVAGEPQLLEAGQAFLRAAGQGADARLVHESVHGRQPRLDVAEKIVGRRVVDHLAAEARSLQWFQLAQVSGRLARESDARAQEALQGLVARPDEQSRREVARGLSAAGGPVELLARLLSDPDASIAALAARGLAKAGSPRCATLLAQRLGTLDTDGKDFELTREIISCIGRIDAPPSHEALKRLAGRRALIKRGRFGEVQELARQALALLVEGGRA